MTHEDHSHESKYKVWVQTLALNGIFGVSQLIVGVIWLGSVSLLADGFHNLSDMLTLGMVPLAIRLLSAVHTAMWSNGKKRFMNFVSLVNFITLAAVMLWAIIEAADRFDNPRDFSGLWLITVGVASLGVNGLTMRLLHSAHSHSHHAHSLALSSAFWHQASDFGSSVVVVISGVVVHFTGWHHIDPILTIILAVSLIGITLTKGKGWESALVVAGATPSHVNMKGIEQSLERLCGSKMFHDLTVTAEGARTRLTLHVDTVIDTEGQRRLRKNIEENAKSFGITDVTTQFDHPGEPCLHRGNVYGAAVLPGEDPEESYGHPH